MTFTKITSIGVEITKEEEQHLKSVINFISSLINTIEENSLDAVGCNDYDDIYYVDYDELCQMKINLNRLIDIQNIC